jgi:hypothetical protein
MKPIRVIAPIKKKDSMYRFKSKALPTKTMPTG